MEHLDSTGTGGPVTSSQYGPITAQESRTRQKTNKQNFPAGVAAVRKIKKITAESGSDIIASVMVWVKLCGGSPLFKSNYCKLFHHIVTVSSSVGRAAFL